MVCSSTDAGSRIDDAVDRREAPLHTETAWWSRQDETQLSRARARPVRVLHAYAPALEHSHLPQVNAPGEPEAPGEWPTGSGHHEQRTDGTWMATPPWGSVVSSR